MNASNAQPDRLLIEASECFMYPNWCETMMRDFVVPKKGGVDMRRRYSEAFCSGPILAISPARD